MRYQIIHRLKAFFARPQLQRLDRLIQADKARSTGEMYWTGEELRMMAEVEKLAQVSRRAVLS